MAVMRFLASLAIFLFAWLPLAVVGLPVIAALLLTSWQGRTSWFGNYLYGRQGNHHVPPNPSFWQQWNFLAVRNPVSNFGKFTLSRGPEEYGVWLSSIQWWRLGLLYGWKFPDDRAPRLSPSFCVQA